MHVLGTHSTCDCLVTDYAQLIFTFSSSLILERPVFEETDGIDVPSVEFSDDEYDVDSSYGTAYETQDTPDKRQQEVGPNSYFLYNL